MSATQSPQGPARRDRPRGGEGHPDALGAREGPARAAGPPAGLLPDRARARDRRRAGRRGARAPARGGRGGAAGAFRRGRRRRSSSRPSRRGPDTRSAWRCRRWRGWRKGWSWCSYGDVPLLRRETLEELVGTARRYGCLALVTATPPDPTGYGRILRDERGHVIGVVEQKDASAERAGDHRDQRRHLLRARRLLPRGRGSASHATTPRASTT